MDKKLIILQDWSIGVVDYLMIDKKDLDRFYILLKQYQDIHHDDDYVGDVDNFHLFLKQYNFKYEEVDEEEIEF